VFKDKNVLITGGKGMVGRALTKLVEKESPNHITIADLPDYDLRDRQDCEHICHNKDIIFHVAGIKGSPQRCMESPASFSVPMIQFNANMIEAAYNAGVEWFLYTSSVGVYHPADVFVEDDVWETFPSENDWYAGWAKRVGEMNVEAYMKQHDWNRCSIVRPANIYGANDNFGQWSMVVPSLIKKAVESKDGKLKVWGDGSPIRDLIYAEDVARGMIHMVENKVTEPVNLGSGTGVTIKRVAEIVADNFDLEIEWEADKPMGDSKRVMDTSRAESYGFKAETSFEDGIRKTIEWYKENKDV
jgi:GDP-L-fucose synthase